MSVDLAVFGLVLAARLLLPLLIFRYPIVGILICLVLDGVDQTIFQLFTTLDLAGYQSYDKALDVYYLALAYIATMRNWVSRDAYLVSGALFYYRLLGVVVFELTGAQYRALLMLFPNTFEYFFIFYELVRSRWDPRRGDLRFWVLAAGAIWLFVKLPQEYWIHVAQLDATDTIRAYPLAALVVFVVAAGLLALLARLARPRVPAPDHALQLVAGPLPPGMDQLEDRLAYRIRRRRILDLRLVEKVVLVTLVSIIFAELLPGVEATVAQITTAVGLLVTVNALLYLFTARRGWGIASALGSFVALAVFNVGFVVFVQVLQPEQREYDLSAALFFICLLTLIVSTYDRYRPVLDVRWEQSGDVERAGDAAAQ